MAISSAGAVKPVKENENPKLALDFRAPSVSEYPDRISVRFARSGNREADLLDLEPFEGFFEGEHGSGRPVFQSPGEEEAEEEHDRPS
ncbi:hypothetical protein ACFX13_038335 [Malus domestica]